MAHAEQTLEARWSFAFWHLIRVQAGIVNETHGASHYGLTETQWKQCKEQVNEYVRKAAARILVAA